MAVVVSGDSCVLSGGARVSGRVKPPGDKSISHRALLLAALAQGESRLIGLSNGQDVAHTAEAVQALGAELRWDDAEGQPGSEGKSSSSGQSDLAGQSGVEGSSGLPSAAGLPPEVTVHGGNLREPSETLYLGNSGTSLRLLAGVCASLPIVVTLDGDASLRSRPMRRIAEPLTQMGAVFASAGGSDGPGSVAPGSVAPGSAVPTSAAPSSDVTAPTQSTEITAPLTITGGHLSGLDYTLPVASAQVKGAILLAGLRASGQTTVRERHPTRAHTEEMLKDWGADITVDSAEEGSRLISVMPSQLTPRRYRIPSDPSQAAFWTVAAVCAPESDVAIENVYLGPGRDGFIKVLERMGARIVARPATRMLHARTSELVGTEVAPSEIPGLIDEIPILAVAAAHAQGATRFVGVEELRAKESNRVDTIAAMITALGGQADATDDTLVIEGTGGLSAGQVDSHGDHRIAMSAAVAGLITEGETAVVGWDCVATSYPAFLSDLAKLTDASVITDR